MTISGCPHGPAYLIPQPCADCERELAELLERVRVGCASVVNERSESSASLQSEAPKSLSDYEIEVTQLRQEIAEAMAVLAPNMPESGLVDACKQVKQVAISEADNAERALAALQRPSGATCQTCQFIHFNENMVDPECANPENDIMDGRIVSRSFGCLFHRPVPAPSGEEKQ